MTYKLPGLSYCGGKVPGLSSHLNCSKKSLLREGDLHKIHPAQWIYVQKVGKKWLCEHNPTQTLQLWGVLKSPSGISSGKSFCTSQPVFQVSVSSLNVLTPATASIMMQPLGWLPKWEEFPLKSDTGKTSFSSKEVNKLLWTPWASNTLNNPGLEHRELFCHRGVPLKKRTCEKQCLFWEKLWERTLREGKLIQGLTVLI